MVELFFRASAMASWCNYALLLVSNFSLLLLTTYNKHMYSFQSLYAIFVWLLKCFVRETDPTVFKLNWINFM